MTVEKTNQVMKELKLSINNRDYLTIKIDEAIQERNLNKIIANYVMREELSKQINIKILNFDEHIQQN
jgi:hypothetical protein